MLSKKSFLKKRGHYIECNNISINILINHKNTTVANHISKYLVKLGININNIKIVTSLEESAKLTHLIIFEEILSGDIFSYTKSKDIKLLIVEENFLDLKIENLDEALLISQYSYYGELLHSFVVPKRATKILLVDDDIISITLLKAMLEDEYCELSVAQNGEEWLELLNDAFYTLKPLQ